MSGVSIDVALIDRLLAEKRISRSRASTLAGMQRDGIRSWANGHLPTVPPFYRLSRLLGVSMEDLIVDRTRGLSEARVAATLRAYRDIRRLAADRPDELAAEAEAVLQIVGRLMASAEPGSRVRSLPWTEVSAALASGALKADWLEGAAP